VLALPRGGVPVAHEIAAGLSAPLDLMLVRKLGAPDNEELAIGAIAMPDIVMLNENIVSSLSVPQEDIDCVIRDEMKEMQRRNHLYRADAPPPQLKDREVIIIDDGMATGADMRAAVAAVAAPKPARQAQRQRCRGSLFAHAAVFYRGRAGLRGFQSGIG